LLSGICSILLHKTISGSCWTRPLSGVRILVLLFSADLLVPDQGFCHLDRRKLCFSSVNINTLCYLAAFSFWNKTEKVRSFLATKDFVYLNKISSVISRNWKFPGSLGICKICLLNAIKCSTKNFVYLNKISSVISLNWKFPGSLGICKICHLNASRYSTVPHFFWGGGLPSLGAVLDCLGRSGRENQECTCAKGSFRFI